MWAKHELTEVSCDLCGSQGSNLVIQRADGLQAVECSSCRLAYINPRPKDEQIQRLYGAEYFRKDGAPAGLGYEDYTVAGSRKCRMGYAETRLECIRAHLPFWPHTALEVGCALGEFCQLMAGQGTSVVGLDISEFAIERARAAHPGLDFRVGTVSTLAPDARFEAIFAFHVVEHVLSPTAFVRDIRDRLEPNGVLVLATPNYECAKRLGASNWAGFQQSLEHLYFFDPRTLTALVEKAGLKPLHWMSGGGSGRISAPAETLKSAVRKTLAAAGVLPAIRRIRARSARSRAAGVLRDGTEENYLLGIFQLA